LAAIIDLKSMGVLLRVGSSPTPGTIQKKAPRESRGAFLFLS